jgi:uncharacterized protein YciI
MPEWLYFLHAPRPNFAATMDDDEQATFGEHVAHLARLLDEGTLLLAGPTGGETNTGICVFEAADEDAARAVMEADPVIAAGICAGELRPFRAAFLRGRP